MSVARPRDAISDSTRWSISLVEASKAQAKRREEEERFKRWNAGNHDSTNFFRKMGQSLADTERYKAQCRTAALASPSRNAEEKVSLECTTRHVDIAKAFADFSNVCIVANSEGQMASMGFNSDCTVDAPKGLMHLKDPNAVELRQQMNEAALKVQAFERGRKARKQVASESGSSKNDAARGEDHQQSQQLSTSVMDIPADTGVVESTESRSQVERKGSAEGSDGEDEFGEDELSPVTPAITIVQPSGVGGGGSQGPSEQGSRRTSRRTSEDSSHEGESDGPVGDDWPPKPPIVRFRAQMEFSKQFEGPEKKDQRRQSLAEADELKKLQGSDEVLQDMTLTWVNMYFKLDVQTERQLTAGFPIIVLSMMDVIYPKKIRWHQVNWNTAYMRALKQNHTVLNKHWYEVNMNKVKDLRQEVVGHIEATLNATAGEKLDFLKQVKRWFDCRVLHSNAYDPVKRRTEMEQQIRLTGRWMKFPVWMEFDKEEIQFNRAKKPNAKDTKSTKKEAGKMDFEKMPEFKRLLWFLGSSDHQTM